MSNFSLTNWIGKPKSPSEGRRRWQQEQRRKNILRFSLLVVLILTVIGAGATVYIRQRAAAVTPLEFDGKIINVRKGGNLQAALNQARPGDTVVLEAGAEFVGSFELTKKVGEGWVTIQSSRAAELADNIRVKPGQAALMPKILSPGKDQPAILTQAGAHHYRFVGIEFSVSKPDDTVWKLIYIGDDAQNKTELVPRNIVFDRCYVHAHLKQTGRVRSGLSINGSNIEILNSHVSDFRLPDDEGHAIVAWNAPGPFRIVNNYIEASGINVLFGGAMAHQGMNPADLEFRRNHVAKKIEWRDKFTVKNLFELKDMRRAVIEENIFENNWISAQAGTAIVLTPASLQSGANARVEDITFRSNIIRRTSNGFVFTGTDYGDPNYPKIPVQNNRVKIENNLLTEIGGKWGGEGTGRFLVLTSGAGPDYLTVNHNTVIHDGSTIILDGGPSKNFIFTNNIAFHNDYGVIGVNERGSGIGSASLAAYAPRCIFRRNILVGAEFGRYPSENFYPPNLDGIGFVNPKAGDYGLAAGSRFKGKAADGKDVGCDVEAIAAMEKKVLAGVWQ